MSKLNNLIKLAFFFDKRTKAQKESDRSIKKDYTKKPYPIRKPEWRNLWNSDTRSGQSTFLRGGNTSGVSSKQVLDHFRKKYKMDVGFNKFTDPRHVNSFYVQPEDSAMYKHLVVDPNAKNRKLNFFERHFTTKKYKETVPKRIEAYKKLKKTFDKNYKKRDGNIGMDEEVLKYSPEIIAHELGHAHNYTKSKNKNLYKFFNGIGGASVSLAGLGIQHLLKKRNPALGLAIGSSLSVVPAISQLIDEYKASKKGTNAIKELGGTPHPGKLRSGFSSYIAGNARSLTEAGLGLVTAGLMYKYRNRL